MRYRVEISDVAQAEADAAYLWISQFSPDRAAKWYDGLLTAIESLSEFPLRCPIAPENDRFAPELRQLIYGRITSAYRILFTIFESPDPSEDPEVRILHVRHGARRPIGRVE